MGPYTTPATLPAYNVDNSSGSLNTQELYIDGSLIDPNTYALKESTTFTLDSGFNNFINGNGDWVTIAQVGEGNNRNVLRAEGLFIIHESTGSHHCSVVLRAGVKFSSGVYLDVESCTWFAHTRILEARIKYEGTYDGAVLQIKFGSTQVPVPPATTVGAPGTFYLTLYQNLDNQGWKIIATGTNRSADPNPTIYVTDSPSTPGPSPGVPAQYSKERNTGPLDWDPNNRNSISKTTKDHSFYKGAVEVNQGTFTVGNSTGVNIECNQTPGNIVLDTIGNTVPPSNATRGISLASHEGMLLQCNNDSAVSDPGVFVVDGNVWYFNTGGFNMNGKNVVGAQQMESNVYTRNTSSTISIGEISSAPNSGKYVFIREPTIIYRTHNQNGENYLNSFSGASANGMQFHDSTNHYQVIRRNQENWGMTSPYQKTYICALSLRNAGSTTVKRLQSQGSTSVGTVGRDITGGHPGGEGYDMWNVSSSTQGASPYIGTKIYCPNDVYIRRVLMQDYGHRCVVNNSTGSSQNVSFEIWLAHGPSGNSAHNTSFSWYSSSWPTTDVCPANIRDLNNTSNAILLDSHTRTFSTGSSVSNSYPFNGGSNISVQQNYDVVSLNGGLPYKIPAGHTYGIFLIERRVNAISSGSLIFTSYLSNVGSSGFASQPIKFEIYGEINYLS